jgi:hypothetical protein
MMRMTSFHVSSPSAEGSRGKEEEESHENVLGKRCQNATGGVTAAHGTIMQASGKGGE